MSLGHAIKSRISPMLRWILETGQRFGVNVTPNHFYSEIPDFRLLRSSDYWKREWSMRGILGADISSQLQSFRECCEPYRDKMMSLEIWEQACKENGEIGFGQLEALVLYAYLRCHKPPRIVQVGCGVSTFVMQGAVRDEPGYNPEIVCVEPYPTAALQQLMGRNKRVTLLRELAQMVPADRLADVGSQGLLFIDSSHSTRIGSDVTYLITEVLPRLPAGSGAHFHDIFFPYEYQPEVLGTDVFFGRETVLLYAFLACNSRCQIDMSLSMLHHQHPAQLKEIAPVYQPRPMVKGVATGAGHYPSSCYLRFVS